MISQMILPGELWDSRRSIVEQLENEEYRILAAALMTCSEAAASEGGPSVEQKMDLLRLKTLGASPLTGLAAAIHGALDHVEIDDEFAHWIVKTSKSVSVFCLLYTSPSPRDQRGSRMPSSA